MSNFVSKHTRVAFSDSFDATIASTGTVWKVTLKWKDGRNGAAGFTTMSENAARAELTRLDSSVKFATREPDTLVSSVKSQIVAQLAVLRDDPKTTAAMYAQACRREGVAPEPRPDFTGPSATGTQIVPMREQAQAYSDFQLARPEVLMGQHAEYNSQLIERYLADEGLQMTWDNLHTAFVALESRDMFRHASSGRAGGTIVRPYDIGEIRKQRAENKERQDAVVLPPAGLTGIDLQVWDIVRKKNPTLDTRSPKFADRMKEVLVEEAVKAVRQTYPNVAEGSAVERKLIDDTLLAWARAGASSKLQIGNTSDAKAAKLKMVLPNHSAASRLPRGF